MNSVDAQWIRADYTADSDGNKRLNRLSVAVHATGSVMSGIVVQFIYEVTPAQSARYEHKDDGIAVVESQPVTGPPHHWYWRRIDR